MSPEFIQRMIRAAKLDVTLYEEVEKDEKLFQEAMLVVILSSVASGIGSLGMGSGLLGVFIGIILALVGWGIWAWITFLSEQKYCQSQKQKLMWGKC